MSAELQTTGTQRTPRRKGERTRQRILQAAMKVIAREGIRGTTHRAIASEAGVQLSLTTYYFKDLPELISETFRLFMERDREDLAERWSKAFAYLDRFSEEEFADLRVQKRITDYLTRQIVDHVRDNLENTPEGLAIEHHFFFEALMEHELIELTELHRQRLLKPLVRFCAYFNPMYASTDAELMLGTITRLEYEALLVEPKHIDYRKIRRQVRRMVSWIVAQVNAE